MPVSHEHDFLLVHVPKNAGTAIQEAFGAHEMTGHRTARQYADEVPELWDDYLTVAPVRNPFDRAVSSYEYARQEESYWHDAENPDQAVHGKHPDYDALQGKSFLEALRMLPELDHHGWHRQVKYVCDEDENVMVDAVVRVESLGPDLRRACRGAGISDVPELPVLNESSDGGWRSYYDGGECQAIVRDWYEEDFETFGYDNRIST